MNNSAFKNNHHQLEKIQGGSMPVLTGVVSHLNGIVEEVSKRIGTPIGTLMELPAATYLTSATSPHFNLTNAVQGPTVSMQVTVTTKVSFLSDEGYRNTSFPIGAVVNIGLYAASIDTDNQIHRMVAEPYIEISGTSLYAKNKETQKHDLVNRVKEKYSVYPGYTLADMPEIDLERYKSAIQMALSLFIHNSNSMYQYKE